jgi:hypothetical protein
LLKVVNSLFHTCNNLCIFMRVVDTAVIFVDQISFTLIFKLTCFQTI